MAIGMRDQNSQYYDMIIMEAPTLDNFWFVSGVFTSARNGRPTVPEGPPLEEDGNLPRWRSYQCTTQSPGLQVSQQYPALGP